jgi:hypothetical protein
MELITRLTFKVSLILIMFFGLFACSKQYETVTSSSVAPSVAFDKDTLKIRVNDLYNTNNNASYLTIHAVETTNPAAYTKVIDSTGTFKVFLDGKNILNQAIDVANKVKLFVSGSKEGLHILNFNTYDRFGQYSTKSLIVNVVPNIAPTGIFTYKIINQTIQIDASTSYSLNGKIIKYSYYFDGIEYTIASSNYTKTLTPGLHEVGLVVTDDLGAPSIIVKKIIQI